MDAGILAALATLESDPDNADALATLSSLIEGGGNGKGNRSIKSVYLFYIIQGGVYGFTALADLLCGEFAHKFLETVKL